VRVGRQPLFHGRIRLAARCVVCLTEMCINVYRTIHVYMLTIFRHSEHTVSSAVTVGTALVTILAPHAVTLKVSTFPQLCIFLCVLHNSKSER
jgi:hypothetical protein